MTPNNSPTLRRNPTALQPLGPARHQTPQNLETAIRAILVDLSARW